MPLFIQPALPACRVGRKRRARAPYAATSAAPFWGVTAFWGIRFCERIPPFGGDGYFERRLLQRNTLYPNALLMPTLISKCCRVRFSAPWIVTNVGEMSAKVESFLSFCFQWND